MGITVTSAAVYLAAMCWLPAAPVAGAEPAISLRTLLAEMIDRDGLARFPDPAYQQLQASSYDRGAKGSDKPNWFANGDGKGFIRTERIKGNEEWVLMDHEGPGCITRMWAPFFYRSMGNRKGPNIRFYLDGSDEPVIDENLIALLTGRVEWIGPPFATETARAGVLFLPIPFARGCKITTTQAPFYNIINYRAYPAGTPVRSFSRNQLGPEKKTGPLLSGTQAELRPTQAKSMAMAAGRQVTIALPEGGHAVRALRLRTPQTEPARLRSLVMMAEFDDEQTIWCPVGDFFSAADRLHRFTMWSREVDERGVMTCRWVMPYRESGKLTFRNLGKETISLDVAVTTSAWDWDDRSMHFHAQWRYEDPKPVEPIRDWNFIEIEGQGVMVGDCWSILIPHHHWWGEGDEKIYIDLPIDATFPTHFGTGTEDYYGWAGGEVPFPRDEFSHPFAANIRVGGGEPNRRTRGYNICARSRVLDAIPFKKRLRFDMEAFSLLRKPGLHHHYSGVTYWYGRPGAKHNRLPQPEEAAKVLLRAEDLDQLGPRRSGHAGNGTDAGPAKARFIPGAIEFETLKPSAKSEGMRMHAQRPAPSMHPRQWSGERHLFMNPTVPGDFVEFRLEQKYKPQRLRLYVTKSFDFGFMDVSVNGKLVQKRLDLYHPRPIVIPLDLGLHQPKDNHIVIKAEFAGPNTRGRKPRSFMGLDCVICTDAE